MQFLGMNVDKVKLNTASLSKYSQVRRAGTSCGGACLVLHAAE
jgi:imidazole glycerol phosphate synthase subunit HisF